MATECFDEAKVARSIACADPTSTVPGRLVLVIVPVRSDLDLTDYCHGVVCRDDDHGC